jgi:putative ABC transport system permease protein
MLKNYILTAWKVFLRRKFFTFINLFGISLTLKVLMVTSTIADGYFYPSGPEKNTDNMLMIQRLVVTNDEQNYTFTGGLGYKFIQDNVKRLQTPEMMSINSGARSTSIFHEGVKRTLLVKKTDANFWKILDFEFVDGRGFDDNEWTNGEFVAVINAQTQEQLYGGNSAIGQKLSFGNQTFTIIGVVQNVSAIEEVSLSDIWVPYTTNATNDYKQEIGGEWGVILYHSNPEILKDANKEYINLLKNDLKLDAEATYSKAFSGAFNKLELLSREVFWEEYSYKTYVGLFISVITGMVFIFMLLPSINMINLNVSRVMERSSEIGVRRAFGASKAQLLMQFIIETILITLVGGVIGMLLSIFMLNSIEASGIIPYMQFSFNHRVFLVGLALILIFGIISGAYPAYKMSRLSPVAALKGAI